MALIIIALTVAAIYSGGMYAFLFAQFLRGRIAPSAEIELHTFHLGLCFILAVGFLGLVAGG